MAVLVALLVVSPLWFSKSFGLVQTIGPRFESLFVPTAAAAVIAPAVVLEATSVPGPQFDAVRLLMAGTMLFGLAAVVRKAI